MNKYWKRPATLTVIVLLVFMMTLSLTGCQVEIPGVGTINISDGTTTGSTGGTNGGTNGGMIDGSADVPTDEGGYIEDGTSSAIGGETEGTTNVEYGGMAESTAPVITPPMEG